MNNKGDLRVWTSAKGETVYHPVSTPLEAKQLIDKLSKEFLRKRFDDIIDYYACGLEVFDPEDVGLPIDENTISDGWSEWYSSDGQDISDLPLVDLEAMHVMMEEEKKKNENVTTSENEAEYVKEALQQEDVDSIYFTKIGVKTTVCCIVLRNEFEVIGTSSCVDPDDYNRELGEKIALDRAMEQVNLFRSYQKHTERFVLKTMYGA